jgi:hypothetical protein
VIQANLGLPEGVIKTLEDDEACIDSGAQKGAVHYCGVVQQHVAGTGHEERWRHMKDVYAVVLDGARGAALSR